MIVTNNKAQRRMFHYKSNGSVPKSIFIDGYASVSIPDLTSTSGVTYNGFDKVKSSINTRLGKSLAISWTISA